MRSFQHPCLEILFGGYHASLIGIRKQGNKETTQFDDVWYHGIFLNRICYSPILDSPPMSGKWKIIHDDDAVLRSGGALIMHHAREYRNENCNSVRKKHRLIMFGYMMLHDDVVVLKNWDSHTERKMDNLLA